MYIVYLKFSKNKEQAGQYMQDHMQWIQKGLSDGIFLMVGSLKPNFGGGVLAHNISREALQQRLDQDPFVKHDVVSVELVEFEPAKADERLSFLLQ